MKWIVNGVISFYQAHISPRKGFTCAFRMLHGGDSCSQAVKKIVSGKGPVTGLGDIRARFSACRRAHKTLEHCPGTVPEKAFECPCDVPGVDGCGDPGNAGSCFGSGEPDAGASSAKGGIVVSVTLACFIVLLLIVGWHYARTVDTVRIKLIEPASESRDGKLSALFGGELPDYQVWVRIGGRLEKSTVLRDRSARQWLTLNVDPSMFSSGIERLTIVDKQPLKDRVLDEIDNPDAVGEGEYYEYRIERNLF